MSDSNSQPVVINVMSAVECGRLTKLEKLIQGSIERFKAVGDALCEIRDSRLYRAKYATWKDYLSERWGLGSERARQLMEAASTAGEIENSNKLLLSAPGAKPLTEGLLRPLAKLPKGQRAKAFSNVVKATKGKPTAKTVKAAVDRQLGKEKPSKSKEKPKGGFGAYVHERKFQMNAYVSRAVAEQSVVEPEKDGEAEDDKESLTTDQAVIEQFKQRLIKEINKHWPTAPAIRKHLVCKLIREML